MTNPETGTIRRQKIPTLLQALTLAALSGGTVAVWLHPVGYWIPGSLAAFSLGWALATRRIGWVAALLLWVPGVHLAMWAPFLLEANLAGDGRLGHALLDTLITAGAVGWYMLTSFPLHTLFGGIAMLLLIALMRARAGLRA